MRDTHIVDGLAGIRARDIRDAENASRQARFEFRHETVGRGTMRLLKPVSFNVVFFDKPIVTSGVEVTSGALDPAGDWPLCQTIVTGWERDTKGHYVGAWLAFVVLTTAAKPKLTHHVVFEAVGGKNLQLGVLETL